MHDIIIISKVGNSHKLHRQHVRHDTVFIPLDPSLERRVYGGIIVTMKIAIGVCTMARLCFVVLAISVVELLAGYIDNGRCSCECCCGCGYRIGVSMVDSTL